MGKTKYYWYGNVKKMVFRYPAIKNENSLQAGIFTVAIEKTLKETEKMQNGSERIKAIKLIYFDKTKTIDGVALELNYSRRTVQSWMMSFINSVGRNAGY